MRKPAGAMTDDDLIDERTTKLVALLVADIRAEDRTAAEATAREVVQRIIDRYPSDRRMQLAAIEAAEQLLMVERDRVK